MGLNSLESYVNGQPAGDFDEVNQSIRRGFQRNPDAYAKSLDLAKKTGVAPELQEGMEQDIDLEAKAGAVPIQKIVQNHSALANHLKDDGFATLAQNDLRSLMGLSAAVQAIPEMKPWNPTLGDKTKAFFRELMEGTTFSSDEEAQAIRQAESARIRTATQMGVNPAQMHTGNAATLPPSRIGAGILRGTLRPLSGAVRYAERKTGIDTGVGSALQGGVEALTPSAPTVADTSVESFASTLGLLVPGLGMQKAVGAIQKIPALAKMPALLQKAGQWAGAAAMAIPEAAAEAQDVYDELIATGASAQQASSMSDRTFWGNAALLAITDKIGWFSGEGLTRRMISEGIQEGGQTAISNTATGRPIMENVPESALMGAGTAGLMNVGGKFLRGIAGGQTTGFVDFSPKVQDTQEFLADLSEGVKSAKISETSPDRVQAFVQDAAKGGQENILIPAKQYFQTVSESGGDPVALAKSLGITNLDEALLAGTDVVIPIGAYAAQVAATDLHMALAPDVRLNMGDMTLREEQEAGKVAEGEAAKITEEAKTQQVQKELAALPTPEIEKFQAQLQAQLETAGFAPDAAAEQARFHAQVFDVLAGSEGLTVEQMNTMFPLVISGVQAGEPKKTILDKAMDRMKLFGAGVKEYAQAVIRGGQNGGMEIDESTGLPLNPDGTVTVYHHTNTDAAKFIRKTGMLKADAEPDVYVTTRQETDTGYGDTAVPINVKPELLQIDDEFPDGRKDFRLSVGKPGGSIKVGVAKTFYQSAPARKLTYSSAEGVPFGTHFNRLDPATQDLVTAAIEKDIDDWYANPDKFFAAYDAEEGTFNGQLVNGDIAYAMIPTVKANLFLGWTASGSVDFGRIVNMGMLNKELRARAIDRAGDLPVAVTAGGQASGKTTAAEELLGGGNIGAVIDAPHDDAKTMEPIVRQILASGKDAEIVFVERPNFGASELSNIRRAQKEGRYVEPSRRAETAARVPIEMLKIGEIFRNQARVGLHRWTTVEGGGFQGVGGRLDSDGKDAMISIRGIDIPSMDVLAQQAQEAYLEAGGPNGFPGLTTDLQAEIEKSLRINQQPRGSSGNHGNSGTQGGGTVQGLPGTLYQGGNDLEKRARAKMIWALSPSGVAQGDKMRVAEIKASESDFNAFDSAVKELQAGDILADKRGFIQVTPGRTFHIGLLEGRDLSTFLHESGHYFLEVMGDLAERPEASDRIKGMWADTLKSFGVASRKEIQTEHHEQFAQQLERYLMEGKAPSEKLRPMFQKFKSWLLLVYKKLDKLGARLNDDVRSVFDRLMAVDAEIEANRPKFETFATPEDMGVTPAEFEIYRKTQTSVIENGRDRLQAEVMKGLIREQKAAYKAEKESARGEVAAGVDSRPDMRALAALTDPSGEIKLNRQSVQDQFGNVRGVPTVEDGGIGMDAAAEMLGFDSGAKLFQVLQDAPARQDLIDTLTDEIMTSRYGDPLLDGTIAAQAVDALKTDKQADVLAMELRALSRLKKITEAVGKVKERQDKTEQKAADLELPSIKNTRLAAQAFVSDMSLRQMNPNAYLLADQKYGTLAYTLKGKKDYAGAVDAKQKQMLNHFLYVESRAAQQDAGKIYAKARAGAKNEFQAMLGKAGQTFQDAYNQILDGYEFRKISGVKLDERSDALAKLAAQHSKKVDANGDPIQDGSPEIILDPALTIGTPKNYQEVPMSELRAVRDALANIEAVARLQLQADINGKRMEYEEIEEIFEGWTPPGERTPLAREGDKLTFTEKGGHLLRGIDAALLKVEWMVDRFDRGDINGPMRTFLKHLTDTAVGKRQELGFQVFSRLEQLSRGRDRQHVAKANDTTEVFFPGRPKALTNQQLTAWAFNMFTAENRNVALLGEGLIDGEGTVSPVVDQALSSIPASEYRFIQGVLDTLETLREPLAAEYRRKTGLTMELKEVVPLTVETSDGATINMRGGYYPLHASNVTGIGKSQEDPLSRQGQGARAGARVQTGMTKKVTGATYQLKLDFSEVLSKHVADAITNITMGETIYTVNKILSNEKIATAMSEKLGPEYVATLKDWQKDVAESPNDIPPMDPVINLINRFKSGATIATLAGSIPSLVVQVSDVAKPMFAPGVSNLEMLRARYDMTIHWAKLSEEIMALSPNVMAHRAENYNREIRDALQSYGAFDAKSRATAHYLMEAFGAMDAQITRPVWLSVYRKGMATHANEDQAIMEADRIINRTFQAGDPNNMSAMFRSRNGWQRLFTTFQNDGNTWYGIISSSIASKKVGRISMALMGAFIGQALGQILKNRGWGDDDKDKEEWVRKQALMTPIGSLPVVGGALDVGLQVSGFGGGGDFTTSVLGRTIKGFSKPFTDWHKHGWDGLDWEEIAIAEAEAVGTVKGIPLTAQMIRSWKYVHKVRTGKEHPEGVLEFTKNVIFGKNPNER